MCGIVGKLNFDGSPVNEIIIQRMCDLSIHRGPDDEGIYLDNELGIGMRRLSIIDVPGGHQPIYNEDKSIWIVFNGEIYNFLELRKDLIAKGHHFSSNSDTETIIHLYEEIGDQCVTRLNGMFAFAIWDAKQRKLFLSRDRLGQKPLHYSITQNGLTFASEIPPLLEDPTVERQLEEIALREYLQLWYVPGPLTMFKGIFKLPPAHTLVCKNGKVSIERYWEVDFSQKFNYTEDEWGEQVLALLEDAVQIRLMSDVPLGAFLSGGIDSSAVVALMCRFSDRPIKTFSIGFDDDDYNEVVYARQVALHLKTDHIDEIIRPDATEVLSKLVWHYGEPFGDESCIPTYYVSQLARQHVTVALSGDGGDENFGGYPRLTRYLAFNPIDSLWGLGVGSIKNLLSSHKQQASHDILQRGFWKELAFRTNEILYPMERYSHEWLVWKDGIEGVLEPDVLAKAPRRLVMSTLNNHWLNTKGWNSLDRLLYLELMTYLPDDLQVKIDIASMATSLEVRAPFLDYRLVELVASMPAHLKYRNGHTKYLLRKLVNPLLPPEIIQRSKWGFSMPIGNWLRNELRPMMEDLLLDSSSQRGIFKQDMIKEMIKIHVSGGYDYSRHLWLLLNFELWYRTFLES